jgi:hypothetical protein
MKGKEEFSAAIKQVRSATGVLPPEGRKITDDALKVVERFAGSLRRERSALKQQNETQFSALAELKGRVRRGEAEIARLERAASEQQADFERLLRRTSVPGIRLPGGERSDASFFILKAQCLACSLHFLLCTKSPESHSGETLHCPECGQHDGTFLTWIDEVKGFIFELVPGRSVLIGSPDISVSTHDLAMSMNMPRQTIFQGGIDVKPDVLMGSLCRLYAQHPEQGKSPRKQIIYEDFTKDGKVIYFTFSVNLGEGRLLDGCMIPDSNRSREEQVRDLMNASVALKRYALESRGR